MKPVLMMGGWVTTGPSPITGIDLSRRLLQLQPNLPIILCTGYSAMINEEKARSMGIRALAHKPLTRKEIAGLIRMVLDEN